MDTFVRCCDCRGLPGRIVSLQGIKLPSLKGLSIQGLESDEEIDSKQMLMECWPDNAAVINTNSPYYFVSPRYKLRVYQDGKVLAERGDRPNHAFYVTEGQVVIRQADDARPFYNIDTEDEEAVSLFSSLTCCNNACSQLLSKALSLNSHDLIFYDLRL